MFARKWLVVGVMLLATRTLRWHWQLRLLWYPCAMGLSFYLLPLAIANIIVISLIVGGLIVSVMTALLSVYQVVD